MWDLLGTCSFATWSCPIESLYLLLVFTAIGQWTCRKRTFSVWIQIGLMFDCLFTRLLFSQFLWGAPSSLGHLNSTLLHSSARVCNLNPARLRVYSLPVSQQLVGVPNIYWGVRCYFLRDWGVLGLLGLLGCRQTPWFLSGASFTCGHNQMCILMGYCQTVCSVI